MRTALGESRDATPRTLLSSGHVLRLLDCSREGVKYLVTTRRLRVVARTPSGMALFDPEDVERLRAERARRRTRETAAM